MRDPDQDPIDDNPDQDQIPEPDQEDRCGSCHDAIPALGPRVCSACYQGGYCPICACKHGARMCPEVAAVWQEQESIAHAEYQQMIAARAKALREEYERMPVWMEAA